MAKGFDTLHIKSAIKNRNKFDLSKTHLTTMNFGEIVPLYVEETIPGDQFKVDANYFSRMAPLVVPTYGKFQFKTMSVFVPYHQIADDADAWLAGKNTWEGETTNQRYITITELHTFVYLNTETGTAENSDYTIIGSNGLQYRKFTTLGKYYVKVLNALGYALPEGVDRSSDSTWSSTIGAIKLSAYPLLAFFKAYNDYMSQSQRYNTSQLSAFLKAVKHGKSVSGFTPSTGQITNVGLTTMFSNLKLNYENDYFTSAWQTANAPIYGSGDSSTELNFTNVPASNDSIVRYSDDNKLQAYGSDPFTQIGQRALDFLKSFDDWVRRNNYSGSRAVQQIYSRFGIKTDDYRSNYAHVISTNSTPIQVGDVTATAESTNVPLGDYAGKGIMNGGKSIELKADDYGLLMIIGYFTVTPMNAYGFDKRVLRNSPLDYYNPEFDGIGADAISAGEFYATPIANPSTDASKDTDVFGYTERYNSYRYGRDMITGEFRDYHNNGDMNTWHTGRLLSEIRTSGNLVAQSSSINTLEQTNSQYNRIFSVTDSNEDKFYLTCQFNVSAIRPIMNLNQVIKLGEGETVVPRNGNTIS